MFSAPHELTRIRVFGGTSAVREPPPFQYTPSRYSPIRAAHFIGQDVTPEMIRAAEALSAKYRKRRARR